MSKAADKALQALRCAGGKLQGVRAFLARRIRANAGKILYYACVAIALSAIAYAADQYRREEEPTADALILPAVQTENAREEAFEIVLPENAQRLRGYSGTPEWNATLRLWETHPAVDYLLDGDAVVSLCDATVCTVGRSGVYGGFIEVEAGEMLLRYACVEPEAAIAPGKRVKTGERIATANESMPSEIGMGKHLHLELEQAGAKANVDMWVKGNPADAD